MRLICIVFLLLMVSISLFAQPSSTKREDGDSVSVSAAVNAITLNDDAPLEYLKNYDALSISLTITITNKTNTPVLLFGSRLNYSGVEIAENLVEFETAKGAFSVYHLATSATFVDEKMWRKSKKQLDTSKPDETRIRVLLEGERISYEENILLSLPKMENDRYKFLPWKKYSLLELKQLTSVFVRLRDCDLLNYGISREQKDRFRFALKLKKRWRSFGNLWLSDISCEPFRLSI